MHRLSSTEHQLCEDQPRATPPGISAYSCVLHFLPPSWVFFSIIVVGSLPLGPVSPVLGSSSGLSGLLPRKVAAPDLVDMHGPHAHCCWLAFLPCFCPLPPRMKMPPRALWPTCMPGKKLLHVVVLGGSVVGIFPSLVLCPSSMCCLIASSSPPSSPLLCLALLVSDLCCPPGLLVECVLVGLLVFLRSNTLERN